MKTKTQVQVEQLQEQGITVCMSASTKVLPITNLDFENFIYIRTNKIPSTKTFISKTGKPIVNNVWYFDNLDFGIYQPKFLEIITDDGCGETVYLIPVNKKYCVIERQKAIIEKGLGFDDFEVIDEKYNEWMKLNNELTYKKIIGIKLRAKNRSFESIKKSVKLAIENK